MIKFTTPIDFVFKDILEIQKDEKELGLIKACKNLVRRYGDSLNIEAKYSENIYYNTDSFFVNNGGDNIFKLIVKQDDFGADYTLQCQTYGIYGDERYRHKRNLKILHRILKRKAENQKKMVTLRNEAVQKINNSIEVIRQYER